MDVSYRWLREIAPAIESMSPEQVADRLAARGAPVEQMTRLGSQLAGVRVGRVRSVRDHPDADRLVLCDVEAGAGAVQVVCGAPNVREGGHYPFAPPGTSLPGGPTVEEAEIRGERSAGMLCSERELGLGADESGLMELGGDPPVGSSLVEALGIDDVRLDVEVTPNRGDLLSHVGVAREVAPGGDEDLRPTPVPEAPSVPFELKTDEREVRSGGVRIRVEDPEGCFRYLGAVIRDVEVGPSPDWMARRLRAAGARPINNVVDATNYVLLEMGQPLHPFDLARLTDETVVVRGASAGESLRTLDGVDRDLEPGTLCICDAERPVALAGVMGGEDSEVGPGTTDVLLECALFEPRRVRASRQAADVSTDASYRFERGVDPAGMVDALRRAVELILATAGGSPPEAVLDVRPRPWRGLTVPLRPGRVRTVLGVDFGPEELGRLLEPLGFRLGSLDDGTIEVEVPGWRSYDVTREVDVIEEIARAHGYDSFPEELGPYRPGQVPDDPLFGLEDDLRDLLVARGFLEAQVPAFAPADEGEVGLLNPISAEESHLRASLLPGLVRRVERNFSHGLRDVRLFELGTCFFAPERDGKRPREETHVALIATGRRRPPHWSSGERAVDVWDLKGWLEEVARAARIPAPEVVPAEAPDEALPGAGADLLRAGARLVVQDGDGRRVGAGGGIRADAVDAPPWADPVWGLELALPAEAPEAPVPVFEELASFPGVDRDLALLVPDDLPARRVAETIREAAGEHLDRLEIFDLYQGEGIPAGTRSVAFRLHFSSPDRTLTDEEVDETTASVVRSLEERLGVERRG